MTEAQTAENQTGQASGPLTPDQMRQALNTERMERERICLESIQKVLGEYRCELRAAPQFVPDGDGRFRVVVATNVTAVD